MIQDFIYSGKRFKIKVLNKKEFLVSLVKENNFLENYIVPIDGEIVDYIDKYIEIFYSGRAANTTRKVRNS
jgi:hypothetical protein